MLFSLLLKKDFIKAKYKFGIRFSTGSSYNST